MVATVFDVAYSQHNRAEGIYCKYSEGEPVHYVIDWGYPPLCQEISS